MAFWAAPLQSSDDVRLAVRDLLRHRGFKPTGRNKPASEYLIRAANEGLLEPINVAVDVCNAVSLHSGLPISDVDLDRARQPFRVAAAPPESDNAYVVYLNGTKVHSENAPDPTSWSTQAVDDSRPDSLALEPEGLETKPESSGLEFERPVSAEMFAADGLPMFQIDAGFRVQGGASRNQGGKHAFSLRFRTVYGALTREKAAERFRRRVNELDLAVIAESARWGDHRRADEPYERDTDWVREQQRLFGEFFPVRSDVVLGRYRSEGLFPNFDAAQFNQHGGLVPDGFDVELRAELGTIYYTTDGSDPRLAGQRRLWWIAGDDASGRSFRCRDQRAFAAPFWRRRRPDRAAQSRCVGR